MKGHNLILASPTPNSILHSLQFQVIVIGIEIALGFWLLSGKWMCASWVVPLAAFGIMASVSLYFALAGQPSCGCLGHVPVSPWLLFTLDILAILCLVFAWQKRTRESLPESWQRKYILAGVSLATLVLFASRFLLESNKSVEALSPADRQKVLEIEGLEVMAEALELGRVWEDRDFVWQLPIKNRTDSDISIQDFIVSCGCCKEVSPRSTIIPAGLTETVSLTLDLSHRSIAELGQKERPFGFEIIPLINRNFRSYKPAWHLHGMVQSRVTLDTLGFDFGDMPVHQQPPVSLKATGTVHVPAQQLEAGVNPNVASIELFREKDGKNTFELTLTPLPSLSPGHFTALASIDVIQMDGKRFPGTTFPIQGIMQPEIRSLPAAVVFGSKLVGETVEAFVVLQGLKGEDKSIERIEVESPDVNVEAAGVTGSPQGQTFRITQRVARQGSQSSRLRFIIRKSAQEIVDVWITVSYTGLATSK